MREHLQVATEPGHFRPFWPKPEIQTLNSEHGVRGADSPIKCQVEPT